MAKRRPELKENPFIEDSQLWLTIKHELLALLVVIRHQWYLFVCILLGIGVLIYILKPLATDVVRISKGQSGSSLEAAALLFKDALEDNGIEVELVPTNGTIEALKQLEENKVDVAITQTGITVDKDKNIVALGSLGYQAFWYFYSGPEVTGDDLLKNLSNKKIYVGRPGTGTNYLVEKLKKVAEDTGSKQNGNRISFTSIDNLGFKEAIDELEKGKLDGMFILAGFDSKNIQRLLANKKIHLLNFTIADALSLAIKGVDVVTLPKASFTISPPNPPQDIKMIAVGTAVLINRDVHPEVQYLILETARQDYDMNEVVFDRPGGFPAFTDKSVKHSKIADKYYVNGPPSLVGEVPHWIASFLDNAWFSLIAIAAILYPLMQFRPDSRIRIYELYENRMYTELFDLNTDVSAAKTLDEMAHLTIRYKEIASKVENIWAPMGAKSDFANLMNMTSVVHNHIKDKIETLKNESKPSSA
jgi:TRAP-type uncharacterized transport system substrate-binding protein